MASKNGLEPVRAAAQEVIDRHVARGYASGIAALVANRDECHGLTAGSKAFGTADPVRRDSLFRIASMTKPITAVAALLLVEDGKLRLDEPVDRLLPELAERRVLRAVDGPLDDTVPAARPITVEDLLTFRLGLGIVMLPPDTLPFQRAVAALELIGFGPPDPAAPLDFDEWLRRLGTLPLMAQPGERWLYTTGSNVLGVLVARAVGQSFPAFLHERIFRPLGMKDTAFFVPPAALHRLVSAYRPVAGGHELYDAPASSAWGRMPAFPAGDAGLVSTVDDFHAFSRFLLDGGSADGRRLLSERAVAAMLRDHLTPAQRADGEPILCRGNGWGYGLAVAVEPRAEGIPAGVFGWNGGLGTSWLADPASGLTAILLTQTMFQSPDPPDVHKEFWRAVFRR